MRKEGNGSRQHTADAENGAWYAQRVHKLPCHLLVVQPQLDEGDEEKYVVHQAASNTSKPVIMRGPDSIGAGREAAHLQSVMVFR